MNTKTIANGEGGQGCIYFTDFESSLMVYIYDIYYGDLWKSIKKNGDAYVNKVNDPMLILVD